MLALDQAGDVRLPISLRQATGDVLVTLVSTVTRMQLHARA